VLRVEYEQWGQRPEDLRELAVTASHARSRERFLALYEMTAGRSATRVAARIGRHPHSVMHWVHAYNANGPEAVRYHRTGGRPPFCVEVEAALGAVIRDAQEAAAQPPTVGGASPPRWTLGRLVQWVHQQFGRTYCRETIRAALHRLKLSWKKAKKLLGRADPVKRQAFLERLEPVLDGATRDQHRLVYLDEAHIHQDADLGYGWSERGERFWVYSTSPGLAAKRSFYGLYLYNEGQVRLWSYPRANAEHTIDVLRRLRAELPDRQLIVFWDGASYHRAGIVHQAAAELQIEVLPLPGYSPDFMPVEALWRWLREDVTYHYCHASLDDLEGRIAKFQDRVNQDPVALADRLALKLHLDSAQEKLRTSK
jgi:transposase